MLTQEDRYARNAMVDTLMGNHGNLYLNTSRLSFWIVPNDLLRRDLKLTLLKRWAYIFLALGQLWTTQLLGK